MEGVMADLKMSIYEAGAISEKEVKWMKDSIDLYGVNEVTARFLLDINNLLSGESPESFHRVFLSALSTFVLGVDRVVTAEMWAWLRQNLLKDNVVDGLERELLVELRGAAVDMPPEMRDFVA